MLVAHLIERGGKLASQLAVLQVLLGRWSRIRKRQFAFLVILALHERLGRRLALLMPRVIDALVHRDAEQPGRKAAVPAEVLH